MRSLAVVALALAGCLSSKQADLEALRAEAIAITAYYQPVLDELTQRVHHLHETFNSDLPDMYNALATANIADDTLGLWSFDQIKPPGPEWRAQPTTLLGKRPWVLSHVDDIVKQGDLAHLERFVQDLRAFYIQRIDIVEADLFAVESWLDAGTRAVRGNP